MQHIGSFHLFRRDSHLIMAKNPTPAAAAAPRLGKPLKRSFFNRSVHEVAPDLIGATLLVGGVGGLITEIEAYHHSDPAAHSFNGPTPRNLVMFGPPGLPMSTAPTASTGASISSAKTARPAPC